MNVRQVIPPDAIPSIDDPTFTAAYDGDSDERIVVFVTPEGMATFENPGFSFNRAAQPGVFRADGTRWDGVTGESDDGRTLTRVPTRWLFAFNWQDDHGPRSFFSN
ncbi:MULTISPECIES: hypothetical protein [unclassified Haladaptatus]|uniref:hypothetical protein n=1 Tax=unclassified Haladaptatus TaxID=2622732 RepID=UPI0023E75F65|nr:MULTISPECIES: hypothetical protein [unclassified Haladaptatus]